eukprot:5409574-Heterocapsa_arctica.AAC.1
MPIGQSSRTCPEAEVVAVRNGARPRSCGHVNSRHVCVPGQTSRASAFASAQCRGEPPRGRLSTGQRRRGSASHRSGSRRF